ncbi:hypothetical protein [Halomonas sp. M20]|uniref:hypothetical protein n=1 Tax=Halomonas sp. M20 TaxID=2763264 RepID=UPI001D0B521F|nr:hypothetical protein [Halomonas sp. M20]
MIESCYWKADLLAYAKNFRPKEKPPRWSEKLQVNFEKDVIMAFFMIRKLIESNKHSKKFKTYKAKIFRSPCVNKVNNLNFYDISQLYDLENEEVTAKNIIFICNQFIHGGATFAYRNKVRNWEAIYTCSDFERDKYIYRIPVSVIIKILEFAGDDYAGSISYEYIQNKDDYKVTIL